MRRILTFALPLLLIACGGAQKKKEFQTAGEFAAFMKKDGWARLGTFGDLKWPATIENEQSDKDEISFKAPNGTPHKYPGYNGYDLRVIELKGANGTTGTYVYRSKDKR